MKNIAYTSLVQYVLFLNIGLHAGNHEEKGR